LRGRFNIHTYNPINGRQKIGKLEREWMEKKIPEGRSLRDSSMKKGGIIRGNNHFL
jgi:hypothetical protein